MTKPIRSTEPRIPVVWIAVIAAVVLAGIVAVVAARGADDEVVARQIGTPVAEGRALEAFPGNGEPDPAVGVTIPTVTGTDFDGEAVTLGPDGPAQVLMFVAHWCPHCQAEVPRVVEHLASSPLPADVELKTVSTSVEPSAANYPPQAWLEDAGWTAPVLLDDEDGTAAGTYGLTVFPYFVAVDADGKVVARASGELSMDQFDLLVDAAGTGSLPS